MLLSAVSSPAPGLSVFSENPIATSPWGQCSIGPQSLQKVAVIVVSEQQSTAVRATNLISLNISNQTNNNNNF